MKDTIRVLAIAPYEGLSHLLKLIGSNMICSIQMQKKNYKDNVFYLFSLGLSPIPKGSSKNGVRYYKHEEIKSNYFTSFFCLTAKTSNLNTTLSEMLSCQPFRIVTAIRLKPHRDLASAAQPCGGI